MHVQTYVHVLHAPEIFEQTQHSELVYIWGHPSVSSHTPPAAHTQDVCLNKWKEQLGLSLLIPSPRHEILDPITSTENIILNTHINL